MFLLKKIFRYTVDEGVKDIIAYNKTIPNNVKKYIKDIFSQALSIDLKSAYAELSTEISK